MIQGGILLLSVLLHSHQSKCVISNFLNLYQSKNEDAKTFVKSNMPDIGRVTTQDKATSRKIFHLTPSFDLIEPTATTLPTYSL